MVGTTAFMAPEYYQEAYDEKVDIFAFGTEHADRSPRQSLPEQTQHHIT